MFGSELDANGHKLELPLLDPQVSRREARALGSAPVFLIVGLVLLLLLPSPWNLIGFAACIPIFLGELAFWKIRYRNRRVRVGVETLIGKTATVASTCRPDGQVHLDGEIWEARCAEGADAGETVTVVSRDHLTLVVERPRPDLAEMRPGADSSAGEGGTLR